MTLHNRMATGGGSQPSPSPAGRFLYFRLDEKMTETEAKGKIYNVAVPCDGCTLCCRGDAVRLLPGDDPTQYRTEPHDRFPGELMLAHKPNGDCVYLGEHGCDNHANRPIMCRGMDCRLIPQRFSWTQARQYKILPVYRRGKELTARSPAE